MARHCTQLKRPRNTAWFKEKLMLAEAQEAGQILDEEQLAFLAGMDEALVAQQTIPQNVAFQTKDLDAYDSDCDDLSSAKAVLMANLSSCDSDVLSEETQDAGIQDTNSSTPNDLLILSLFEQMIDQLANLDKENQRNKMNAKLEAFKQEIDTLKETLSNYVKEKESLSTILNVFKTESKEKESKIEAPRELPKVSLVNDSLKKLKRQLANFNKEVKNKTTSDAITAGAWGFEHTKACFQTEIIPFIKVLKDTFNAFDKTLLDEITEVQTIFNQMEAVVDQCYADKNNFEIQIKQHKIDNDQLLTKIMSQEIMHIAMNSVDILDVKKSCVNECCKCLELEAEIFGKKYFIEKEVYDKLVKSYSTLEKHCISLELATQLNQEIFQKENSGENQNAPTFNQLFEINELKAQSQEKDTSVKNSDLNAQLQEKVFAIAALKNELRKLKEKDVVDTAVSKPSATTIALGMFKINLEPLPPKLLNNREAHMDYLKHTREQTAFLREIVKQGRSLNPLDSALNYACNNAPVKHSVSNAMFESLCAICNKCLFDANHAMCLMEHVNDVNVHNKAKSKRNKKRKEWKPIGKVFTKIGYSWKPNGRIFTIVGNRCPITRITSNKIVPPKESTMAQVATPTQGILVYSRRPKASRSVGSCSKVKNVKSNTPNSMEPNQSWGSNVSDVPSSSLTDCRLSKLFFGLRHNLFSVGHFYDSDLEVAFRKHTCFIRDLEGVDLLKGSRGSNLYTLSLENVLLFSLICLLSKASKTRSCLWHCRLSHLNFDYINSLAKQGLVRGLPKLKYQKDHLCSACALGKSKKHSHKLKAEDSIQEKLYLLHMDLCGPTRDEVLKFVIKFLKMIQVHLNATVRNIKTDNGTKFVNQTLRAYYEEVEISHQTSVDHVENKKGVQ
ncbi:retrovirus-related pol polyprotein from transposon TNT 1-94 [Tanacetum coccineum]